MTKTILIPIDFKVKCLNTLRFVLNRTENEKVDIILMYAVTLSDSITDLLFYSPDDIVESLTTPDFKDALSILKNRFSKNINSLKIELFHSRNTRALRIFLEAHKVNEIHVPALYKLNPPKNGYDPTRLFNDANIRVHEVCWEEPDVVTEENVLEALFYHNR